MVGTDSYPETMRDASLHANSRGKNGKNWVFDVFSEPILELLYFRMSIDNGPTLTLGCGDTKMIIGHLPLMAHISGEETVM